MGIVKPVVAVAVIAVAGVAGWAWWSGAYRPYVPASWVQAAPSGVTLYGNIDQRQISLAFIDSGRIASVSAIEGDTVRPGQVIATLDTERLKARIAEARAEKAAADADYLKARNGTRTEDIAQARAVLASAQSDAEYADTQQARARRLRATNAVSQQDVDAAVRAAGVARASVDKAQKALDLALAGFRSEDIAKAKAVAEGSAAQLALLDVQLKDAQLRSPALAVVTRRLLEAGDMAGPSSPVYSLAVTSPKWVRAWVSETDLVKIHPGQPASVTVDSLAEPVPGRIGSIGQTAEFTPKNVQTEELRTALVYEVRVIVEDPDDRLRLGMPATVRINGHAGE